MSSRDIYLIVCTAVVSSLFTWLALEASDDKSIAVAQDLVEKRNFTTQTQTTDECSNDQSEVVVEDKKITPPTPRQEKTPDDTVATSAAEIAIKAKLDAELESKFARFFDSREDKDFSNLSAQIENRFYEEEWNPNWAEDKERKIQKLFNHNKQLENILPLDISCRSQNCQIVLPATSAAQILELSTTFMQVATNNDLGMVQQSVSFFPDPASSSLVFYISENQHEKLIAQ